MRKLIVAVFVVLVLAASVGGWFFCNYQKKAALERDMNKMLITAEFFDNLSRDIQGRFVSTQIQINKSLSERGIVINYADVVNPKRLQQLKEENNSEKYFSALLYYTGQLYEYNLNHQPKTFSTDFFSGPLFLTMYPDSLAEFRFSPNREEFLSGLYTYPQASYFSNFGMIFFEDVPLYVRNITNSNWGAFYNTSDLLEMGKADRRYFWNGIYASLEDIIIKQELKINGKITKGVLWFEYYPSYNGIWLMMHGLSEKELLETQFFIDGQEWKAEVLYPLVFLENVPADSNPHKFSIKSPNYNSEITFLNQGVNFIVDYERISLDNAQLSMNIFSYNKSITIDSAVLRSKAGNCTLPKPAFVNASTDTEILLGCVWDERHWDKIKDDEKSLFKSEISYSSEGVTKSISGFMVETLY